MFQFKQICFQKVQLCLMICIRKGITLTVEKEIPKVQAHSKRLKYNVHVLAYIIYHIRSSCFMLLYTVSDVLISDFYSCIFKDRLA